MRAFIGIALSEDVRETIAKAVAIFREAAPAWAQDKWVPDANLHVTLKFLGDVPEPQVEVVREALGRAVATIQPFRLELRRMKAVPAAKHASMLWVSGTWAGGPSESCADLARVIDSSLEPLGFELEQRAFKPHVTLVRARRPHRVHAPALDLAEAVLAEGPDSMSVHAVTLYRSVLGGSSPVYETLAEVPLGCANSD